MCKVSTDPETGDDEATRILESLDAVFEPGQRRHPGPSLTLPAKALAQVGLNRDGRPCTPNARFEGWFDPDDVEAAVAGWSRGDQATCLLPLTSRDGAATVLLVGTAADAGVWALPPETQVAISEGSAPFVALAYRPFEDAGLTAVAVASWRLTPMEARTVMALVSKGDLHAGAMSAGLNYETARKALKLALRKANALRQADLVRLLHTAVGGGDVQLSHVPELQQALDLSWRAASAGVLLTLGLTRAEAASTLDISEHAIKDELNRMFLRFDLRTATDLSRMITEAVVLVGVASNPNLTLGTSWSALRPLRFVNRTRTPGRVAVSDFGPASGAPTLLFHSAITGSLLDRGLVRALQSAGLRPIAVERPGFGLSDPPVGNSLEVAVDDILDLMQAISLKDLRLVCRGGEPVAMELGRRVPERIRRAVLINPFTPYAVDSRWDGFMNRVKRLVTTYPEMIEPLARFLSQRATPGGLENLVRSAVGSSPADRKALDDPGITEDYVASARLTAVRTSWGFVNDQRAYLTWRPPVLPDGRAWVRLIGEQDVLYRRGDADSLWDAALPGHKTITVPDAGRLLHASHPHLVVQALTD